MSTLKYPNKVPYFTIDYNFEIPIFLKKIKIWD